MSSCPRKRENNVTRGGDILVVSNWKQTRDKYKYIHLQTIPEAKAQITAAFIHRKMTRHSSALLEKGPHKMSLKPTVSQTHFLLTRKTRILPKLNSLRPAQVVCKALHPEYKTKGVSLNRQLLWLSIELGSGTCPARQKYHSAALDAGTSQNCVVCRAPTPDWTPLRSIYAKDGIKSTLLEVWREKEISQLHHVFLLNAKSEHVFQF